MDDKDFMAQACNQMLSLYSMTNGIENMDLFLDENLNLTEGDAMH